MADIRGEKVTFTRRDIVPLHVLPSAQAEDPLIVDCPPPRRGIGRALGGSLAAALTLVLIAVIAVGGTFVAIEQGAFDRALSDKAETYLAAALGPAYRADVGQARIRFNDRFQLAIEAQDVAMTDARSGRRITKTDRVQLALDPLALLGGQVAVADVEAAGISLDTALVSTGEPLDLGKLRVEAIPAFLESAFSGLDLLAGFVERSKTGAIALSDVEIRVTGGKARALPVLVDRLVLSKQEGGALSLEGDVTVDGAPAAIAVSATREGGRSTALTAALVGANMEPFLLGREGRMKIGIAARADFSFEARRAGEGVPPALDLLIRSTGGDFFAEGIAQEITSAEIRAAYAPERRTLDIHSSALVFGDTRLPFSGTVIDLDRVEPQAGASGFGLDLVVNDASAAPQGSGEHPIPFAAKATGRYLPGTKRLEFDNMMVSTPAGSMIASLGVSFSDLAPEVSFAAQATNLQTAAIKQLWPYWMAPKARKWVFENLFGGTVSNGVIEVFMPRDRPPPGTFRMNADQLKISFDIANARMNIAGDIPPIRDTKAHFDLRGPEVTVDIESGASYFASGQSVSLGGGRFHIPDTHAIPLMADMDLAVSGEARAVAELVTYRPIRVLAKAGFAPEDFTGKVKAEVKATFGIVQKHNPPPPDWQVAMQLDKVGLDKEFAGRHVDQLDGTLEIDPDKAVLEASGRIDEVPMDLRLVQPVEPGKGVKPERVIRATLSAKDRKRLLPGLDTIMDGPVAVELTRLDERRQAVSADLGRTTLSIPWIGWTKGAGIGARAEFELAVNEDGTATIDDFALTGEGFGARGGMTFARDRLTKADFSRVRLAPGDDYGLTIRRNGEAFAISASGKSADIRPVIARMRKGAMASGGGGEGGASPGASVKADFDTVIGFSDEQIRNMKLDVTVRKGGVDRFQLSGLTAKGQPVVGQLAGGEGDTYLQVTSGDAGVVARFAGIYDRMTGGLLNLRLRPGAGNAWNGNIDLRGFRLANEEGLQAMVSTPADPTGRSLNKAVKRDIDVRSERFQRAFARIAYRDGVLALENGILRGEQVGATFQGVVRDAQGNINMTGTFMPAYGLNRLFAELPVIGVLLGNGSDRGLLGITFKLTGAFAKPKLTVNPLSLIAPGVFRQIFEFE